MKRTAAALIILCVLLSGCGHTARDPMQPRTVTAITADYSSGTISLRRQYTDQEKLRSVLNYLRCLSATSASDLSPEQETSVARIVLTYSDGSTKTYDQWGDQYLRIDGGPWLRIPADKGQEFPLLLGLMESDEISEKSEKRC